MKGKRVAVLGIGRSGISASLLLAKSGANCIISDIKSEKELKEQIEILAEKENIEVETGGHKLETILSAELIVISPGVPLNQHVLEKARERNIPIISEIELGYRFLNLLPIIAITGTKGKTTTATLMNNILKREGKDVILAGNIGVPLTSIVEEVKENSIIVAEISSFQLEAIECFKPYIAAILNVSIDHMDRYSGVQEYVEAKGRILENQDKNDFSLLNFDNKFAPIFTTLTKSNLIYFSSNMRVERGVWLEGDRIVTNINGVYEDVFNVKELLIKGPHNIENAMAAIAISYVMKVKSESIVETLKNFKGVEHRQEYVSTLNGVIFINNSQGTNCEAVAKSMLSYDEPLILIMGGRNKGANFSELYEIVKNKVKALVLIGDAKEEIAKSLDSSTRIFKEDSLESAVRKAYELSSTGDCIMLSPACSSFDMFKNYEERGKVFKNTVLNL